MTTAPAPRTAPSPASSVYPQSAGGAITGYKVRWREEGLDGVPRNAAKSFSARKLGSLDRALEAAVAYREQAVQVAEADGTVLRADPAASMTVGELFQESAMSPRRRGWTDAASRPTR